MVEQGQSAKALRAVHAAFLLSHLVRNADNDNDNDNDDDHDHAASR